METIEARKLIDAAMRTAGCSVYYGQAEEKAAFPYAIYSVDTISTIDCVEYCQLEVNVVDYGRDTSTAENIADTIKHIFDHNTFDSDAVSFTVYFDRKNNVEAEDRKIVRRRLVFDFNLYRKEH